MAWFRKDRKPKTPRERRDSTMPEGLWVRCDGCREIIYAKELERNLRVCPKCGHHFRLDAQGRIALLLDEAPQRLFDDVRPTDPLEFVDLRPYADRLRDSQRSTGEADALIVARGRLEGRAVVLAVMNFAFMGGSMGSVMGEKLVRAIDRALRDRCPLIVVSASGGARMQEGAISLMQMAKVSAGLARLRAASLPYVSVMTDPTTGGVAASVAMLGDLNVAEPGATIGFAGRRVIEQTIRETLPDEFQLSEFLLAHGFLDLVVPRTELKETLGRCLRHLCRP